MDQQQSQLQKDIALLRSQGASENDIVKYAALVQQTRATVPMSNSDGVRMVRSEGDVSGAYLDADQKQMDAYARAMIEREQFQRMQEIAYAQSRAPQEIMNPNARVVNEGQQVTATPDGKIIYY